MCDFLTPVPPLECKGTPQTAVDGRFPETTAESLQIQPTHQQRNFNGQVLTKLEQIEQELKKHLPYPCHSAYKSKYIYISKHLSLYNTSVAPASQDIPRHFRQQQARHPRNAAHDSDDWFRCESHPRWGDESAPWADSPGHGIMGPREHQVTGGSTWRKKTFFSASWIFGKGDMHIDFFSGIWN